MMLMLTAVFAASLAFPSDFSDKAFLGYPLYEESHGEVERGSALC